MNCMQARSWSEVDCVRLRGLVQVQWTPEKHCYFSRPFRELVRTMLLVNARHYRERRELWLPDVMLFEIFTHVANSL